MTNLKVLKLAKEEISLLNVDAKLYSDIRQYNRELVRNEMITRTQRIWLNLQLVKQFRPNHLSDYKEHFIYVKEV